MCGRVAYLHVAFPCHIAKVCEKLWILNRFFCTNPVLDNKERAGERRPPSFRMAVRVWGIDYIAISACNLYLNLRFFFFFYDNDIAVPLFTVIRIWKCKTVCKKKNEKEDGIETVLKTVWNFEGQKCTWTLFVVAISDVHVAKCICDVLTVKC